MSGLQNVSHAYYRGCLCGADIWLEVETTAKEPAFRGSVLVSCPVCGRQVVLELNEDNEP